nr:hypothetical protein [Tanacetum cinerariifolium]
MGETGVTGVTGDEHRRSVAVSCDQREIWYSNANPAVGCRSPENGEINRFAGKRAESHQHSVGEQAGEHYGVGSSTEMALDVTGEEVVDQ